MHVFSAQNLIHTLYQTSSNISDEAVEPQPLWEYPGYAQSETIEVAEVNIENFTNLDSITTQGSYILNT